MRREMDLYIEDKNEKSFYSLNKMIIYIQFSVRFDTPFVCPRQYWE